MNPRERYLLTAALVTIAACSHSSRGLKQDEIAPASVAPAVPGPAASAAAPAGRACTTDEQCSANEICVSSKCVVVTPDLAACRTTSAHFAFDRADLRTDDLPALRREARCVAALSAARTLVEGNCDERGTVQYNIALGFRRARAVTKYLEDLGVPPAALSEVSYGKELPICTESSEACWAQNRRADVTPGAQPKRVAEGMGSADGR